jgi:hypothetical protein
MIAAAEIEPKERIIKEGLSDKGKREKRIMKEVRSSIKKNRGSNKGDDY